MTYASSGGPDQTAPIQSDQGLHCLTFYQVVCETNKKQNSGPSCSKLMMYH